MHVTLKLEGTTGLVQHNPQLADPLNEIAQEIAKLTRKKTKTEADYAEIARLEWLGGLYHDVDVGIYMPTYSVLRCFERAGSITRQGTTVSRAVSMMVDRAPVVYDGPREPTRLWERQDFRFMAAVGVQRNKVMRMRPIFRKWSLTLEAEMLEDVMNLSAFQDIVSLAGRAEGLGDARKLGYGRFVAEVIAS